MSDQRLTPREAELILRLVTRCVDLNDNVQDRAKRFMGLANDYGSSSEIHELASALPKLMSISSGPDHEEPVAEGQMYRDKAHGLEYIVRSLTAKTVTLFGESGRQFLCRTSTLLRDFERVS